MKESRKRKSTVPMGVFGPAIDPSFDQPTEREEAVGQSDTGTAMNLTAERAVLDVSLDHSESTLEITDSFVAQKSDPSSLELNDSTTDVNSDENVEELPSNEAPVASNGFGAAKDLRDSRPGVEDGDPVEVVAEKIDRFSVRVSALPSVPSEGEEPSLELDSSDSGQEKRHLSDAAADLGDAMKALFDNRKESKWEDFISAEEEAETADQREASESSSGDEVVEIDDAEPPFVPDSLQVPIAESAISEVSVDPTRASLSRPDRRGRRRRRSRPRTTSARLACIPPGSMLRCRPTDTPVLYWRRDGSGGPHG